MSTIRWILSLNRLGVKTDYEDEISRRIVFSNVVFISLPIVYLIFMVIDYESYLTPISELHFDNFVVPIIITICLFCLWLNNLGKTTTSRVLFIGLWPLLLHIIPIKLLQTPSDYYLAFPFGIVFHSMLSQLMLSHGKERALFWFCLLLNFLTIIFSPSILTYFDIDHDIPKEMMNDRYYLLDGVLYWLLFNLVTFYILTIIESYIKKVNDSKELIERQKEELNLLNRGLEILVNQRTSELEEQNSKLRKHAFFNAHLLRGPFCRIQGLIQLQDTTDVDYNNEEIKSRLNESIQELDERIREIQNLVDTKE